MFLPGLSIHKFVTLQDKQGIVKKIYGGILFLYNESEEQNNGYICTKARFCEKVEPTDGACNEKVCILYDFQYIAFFCLPGHEG